MPLITLVLPTSLLRNSISACEESIETAPSFSLPNRNMVEGLVEQMEGEYGMKV